MSFQNNSTCLPQDSGSLATGELCYDSSTRTDQKRGHQWLMDTSEQELLFIKKQAIESVKEVSGSAAIDGFLRLDVSTSQSEGQTGDRLFIPKPVRSSRLPDENMRPFSSAPFSLENKGNENQLGNDPSVCLTMSSALDDALYLNTGLRKVKVNEVTISENRLPEIVGNTFGHGVNQSTGNNMFLGPTYNSAYGSTISMDPSFNRIDRNFFPVGQTSSNVVGNLMFSNQYCTAIHNNMLSVGQAFNGGNYNINTVAGQYEGPTYSNVHDNNISTVNPFYNTGNVMCMSGGPAYSKVNANIAFCGYQDATVVSLGAPSVLPVVEKGEQNTISFGGFQDNPEERHHYGGPLSSNVVLVNQSSAQFTGALAQKESAELLSAHVLPPATSRADGKHKNKEPKTKKGSSSNFPSNVKSLLSTGILDGVPVKYVSWSREKNLRGVVKGAGYLCSCQECKLSKVINAYEFERHAGCKTKHPNNHIYFENGKTIYAVVQELKSTPQEMLFEVIQNVTGYPVNQKNFSLWKASYNAATRELQRIYSKDELIIQS